MERTNPESKNTFAERVRFSIPGSSSIPGAPTRPHSTPPTAWNRTTTENGGDFSMGPKKCLFVVYVESTLLVFDVRLLLALQPKFIPL